MLASEYSLLHYRNCCNSSILLGQLGSDSCAGLFLIVKVDRLILEDLVVLVTLAEDDDDIVLLGHLDGAVDGMAAVHDELMVLRADGLIDALFDLREDELRVLRARVVRRRNDDIRELRREAAHDWALRAVAVAAAAEDRDDALLRDLARRLEDVLNAVRCMRIVDDT